MSLDLALAARRGYLDLLRLAQVLGLLLLWTLLLGTATGLLDDPGAWVERWQRWDAHAYARIWREGYASDPVLLAFPPGYAWLAGGLSTLCGLSFAGAALVINLLAVIWGGRALMDLCEQQFGLPGPPVLVFWLSAPAAYFLLVPYSDAVFCSLLLVALRSLLRPWGALTTTERVVLLAVLLVLPLLRITAYALLPLLALGRWPVLALLPGLGLWLGLNLHHGGDALHFLRLQQQYLMPEGTGLDGLRRAWQGLGRPPELGTHSTGWLQMNLLPLTALGLFGLSLGWLALRRQWTLALSLLAIGLMSHNQAYWRSVMRYDLAFWPFLALPWLALARGGSHPLSARTLTGAGVYGALLLAGLLLQIHFARVFQRGGWAF